MNKIEVPYFLDNFFKSKEIKNLLIIGNYGNKNIGDDAILDSLLVLLRKYKLSYIGIPARHPNLIATSNSIKPNGPLTIETAKAFWNCDALIIGGGGLFSTYMGTLPRLIPLLVITAKLLNKRIVFLSLGFYSATPKSVKWLTKFSMIFSDAVLVRDVSSFNELKDIVPKDKLFLTKDLALYLPFKTKIRKSGNMKKLCICLRPLKNPSSNKIFLNEMYKFILLFEEKYQKWEIFILPFSQGDLNSLSSDQEFSKIVRHKKIKFINKILNYTDVIELFKRMDLVIAIPFHSMVFSKIIDVNFIGISYDEKCTDFLRSVGKKVLYCDTITARELLREVETNIGNLPRTKISSFT